ncbi:MAG: hypothetical protein IJZ07_04945 [Clostridia bacterium]|nr:hypothetical protein [Clostridia bacterium]MBQ9849159.1 hypothetical protein [Clostridia bacterium]MBR2868199.1 hypothetical protein [Clostridia bacterium]
MNKNIKIIFSVILVFTLMFSSVLSSSASASDENISPYTLNKPNLYWDLSNEQYNFSGSAEMSNLYSNYLFTDVSKVRIYVKNNHSTETLKVKLLKQTAFDIDWSVSTENIAANGYRTWDVTLDEDSTYMLKFYAPSDFEGYIMKI